MPILSSVGPEIGHWPTAAGSTLYMKSSVFMTQEV